VHTLGTCEENGTAQCTAAFRFLNAFGRKIRRKSALRSSILLASHELINSCNSCTDLDKTLLYISISGTYSKCVRDPTKIALGVCLPQPCPSAGRMFAASRSRLNQYCSIDSFPQKTHSMKYFENWIPLNPHARFSQTLP